MRIIYLHKAGIDFLQELKSSILQKLIQVDHVFRLSNLWWLSNLCKWLRSDGPQVSPHFLDPSASQRPFEACHHNRCIVLGSYQQTSNFQKWIHRSLDGYLFLSLDIDPRWKLMERFFWIKWPDPLPAKKKRVLEWCSRLLFLDSIIMLYDEAVRWCCCCSTIG